MKKKKEQLHNFKVMLAKIGTAQAVQLCCGKHSERIWVPSSQPDISAHFPACLTFGWVAALSVGFLPPPCGQDHLQRISLIRAAGQVGVPSTPAWC